MWYCRISRKSLTNFFFSQPQRHVYRRMRVIFPICYKIIRNHNRIRILANSCQIHKFSMPHYLLRFWLWNVLSISSHNFQVLREWQQSSYIWKFTRWKNRDPEKKDGFLCCINSWNIYRMGSSQFFKTRTHTIKVLTFFCSLKGNFLKVRKYT